VVAATVQPGGGDRTVADRDHRGQLVRIERILDPDPPRVWTGDAARHVSACGQAVVGLRQLVEGVRSAFDGPALHDATRVQPGGSPYVEGPEGLDPGLLPEGEDFGDLGWAVRHFELASVETGDVRVFAIRAEDAIRCAEDVEGFGPGSLGGFVVQVPAAQGEADRHAHHVLDVPCRAHLTWSRALCRERM
jgi:hypothetical protein